MKKLSLLLVLLVLRILVPAQPAITEQLKNRYAVKKGIDAKVTITIDIPGITAPTKTVEVYLENGKSPKIRGAGLIFLPRRGVINNFSEFLSARVQWIQLSTAGDIQTFKVVSLDPDSDWITADLTVNVKETRIDEIDLVTRESGTFLMRHTYGNGNFPDRTEITFSTDKFPIPLKFLGKTDHSRIKESGGKVKGKITLEFVSLRVF
jgi:hypothetical protein